jgi:hypothetical protein
MVITDLGLVAPVGAASGMTRVDTRVSGIGLNMPAMSGGSGAYSTTGIFTNVTARYRYTS